MQTLPTDVMFCCIEYLAIPELYAMMRASKTYYKLILEHDELFAKFCLVKCKNSNVESYKAMVGKYPDIMDQTLFANLPANATLSVKYIFVGPSKCGKSVFSRAFALNEQGNAGKEYQRTIGVEYISGHSKWDTSGYERFRSIVLSYFRAHGVVMYMFDLNDAESLQLLDAYVASVPKDYNPCIRLLLGCKCELQHQVSSEEIEAFLKKHSSLVWEYWPVSSFSMHNVKELHQVIDFRIQRAHTRWSKKPIETPIVPTIHKPPPSCIIN